MSVNVKFQHIHSFPRVRRQWRCLTKDEKLYVLEGMDLGLTETWIQSLIDEVRDARKGQPQLY